MVTTEEMYTEVKFATHRNLSLNAAAKEVGTCNTTQGNTVYADEDHFDSSYNHSIPCPSSSGKTPEKRATAVRLRELFGTA